MRVLVGISLVAGCGQGLPARPAEPVPAAAPVAALKAPRATFDVVPAELGDDHVLDRIGHRAIVAHWGLAWFADDGAPIGNDRQDSVVASDVVAVLAERATRIRIVVEDDHARVAAWIPRADTAQTLVVPQQLVDPQGAPIGVWLEPGIVLAVKERAGDRRQVAIVDEELAAGGLIDARALGNVWVAPAGRAPASMRSHDLGAWTRPRDPRPLVRVDRGAVIRAAPQQTAAQIASLPAGELTMSLVARGPAFTEVEVQRPHVRVRGFVDNASILGPTDDLTTHGTGSGHGFGMSHAARFEVPAGTCLYDRAGGDVIGVTLVTETRYGGAPGDSGFALVYIDTPWNVAALFVKNLETEPTQPPRWDSCTEPAVRR